MRGKYYTSPFLISISTIMIMNKLYYMWWYICMYYAYTKYRLCTIVLEINWIQYILTYCCCCKFALALTIFNKIAIQATTQMAADKEAFGLSSCRPKIIYMCILSLRDNCLFCS